MLLFCFFPSAEIKKYEEQYHAIEIPNEESVITYFKIRQQLAKLGKEIQEFTQKPKYCLPFLQPGRLVKVRASLSMMEVVLFFLKTHHITALFFLAQVKNEDSDFGWGVVVNFCKKSNVKVSGRLVVSGVNSHATVTNVRFPHLDQHGLRAAVRGGGFAPLQ